MKSIKTIFLVLMLFFSLFPTNLKAQPLYDYSKPFLATSQLGFRENSPKEVSFYGGEITDKLPDEIPFYITKVGYRLPRTTKTPKPWTDVDHVFRWPFNETIYPYSENADDSKYGG